MANYELWLTNDSGARIAQLTTFLNLSASRTIGKVGWFSLYLPKTFNIDLIRPDRMVQIWRAPIGGQLKLWQVYFIRKWTFATSGSNETIQLEGPDPKDLLRRRIIAAYSASAQATKTDFADDMMKEIVTESIANGVAPTPDSGTRVWSNLSIAGDDSLGPTITKSFTFDRLFTPSGQGALPAIQKASREAGTEVFFDVVPDVVSSNAISFLFQTYIQQPGQDVSAKVIFDQTTGNMLNPILEYDYSEEENYIYAGGQGEEADRNVQQVYDINRYGASIWNRCENFADARNQTEDNGVREVGRNQLEEGRPKINFSATLLDTEGTRFGRDWDYGYRVTTKYKNIEFASIVRAVTLQVDSSGERIQARIDYRA